MSLVTCHVMPCLSHNVSPVMYPSLRVSCNVSVITCHLSCTRHYVSPVLCHLLCSEWSECFTFHTGISVPGKPPPPSVTTAGVTYIGVQWEGTKSCDGHVISYKLEMEDRSSVSSAVWCTHVPCYDDCYSKLGIWVSNCVPRGRMPLDSRALVPQELLQVPCKWSWAPLACRAPQPAGLPQPARLPGLLGSPAWWGGLHTVTAGLSWYLL